MTTRTIQILAVALLLGGACALPATAQTKASDQELINVLKGKSDDVPGLLRGLTELRPSYRVSGAQLKRVLAGVGIPLDGFVGNLLDGCQSLSVAGRDVSIRYSKTRRIHMTDDAGTSLGYLHLDTQLKTKVAKSGRELESIRGIKVSKKSGSMRVDLQRVKVGANSFTISAGKFGIKLMSHTFTVPTAPSAGVAGALPK